MTTSLPYRTLAPWLRERFGRPVHRVALDAGSTCPNRDGTKGFGGCTYCDVEGSGTGALKDGDSLEQQLQDGLRRIARRRKRPEDPEPGVIAYLQSYSNTYVDNERFREVLGVIERELDRESTPVVAVSVATRPDCLPDETLRELERLGGRVDVWVELGLESASDDVLLAINRLHTLEEFHDAARRAGEAGLVRVAHAILGLPGDGRAGARATAAAMAEAGVEGVKVHQLMVLKKTQMAHQWRAGEIETLSPETYVEWLADFLEILQEDQILHRITGDSMEGKELAPLWSVSKNRIREMLVEELSRRPRSG